VFVAHLEHVPELLQVEYRTPSCILALEIRCKATWKRILKLQWREAGPPHHHDDHVDLDP